MKKTWLAVISAAALIIGVPGLASAGGTHPGTRRSYVSPAAAAPGHQLVRTHPAHPFQTHPFQIRPLRKRTKFNTIGSSNWSGFAAYGDHFRRVSATYSIPSVNCTISPDGSFDSEWVGLDGYGDTTVEQVGTSAECSGGTASYFAFTEMYPRNPIYYTDVSAGDSITLVVYYSSSARNWDLSLTDNTTGATISQSSTCPPQNSCKNASADIISEVPDIGTTPAPLADYGTVGFTEIAITDASGRHYNLLSPYWKNAKIFEVDSSGNEMQAPGTLEGSESGTGGGYANQAFTDTSLASS